MKIALALGMPRRKVPFSDRFPYHVMARANNKDWFYAPLPLCWAIFCAKLAKTIALYEVRVLSFVMMSNHIHLIVQTPQGNIGSVMNYFLGESSRGISTASGRTNHVFGGPYKGTLIESSVHFANVYKYVYRNPVEAALSDRVENYRYSSLRWILNNSSPFPVLDTFARDFGDLSMDWSKRLPWLNSAYDPSQKELIRRALRHSHFKLSSDNNYRAAAKSLS